MSKRGFAAFWLSFGLGFALFSSASCITCPAGQQSCGNSNPGASAADGGASDSDTATCDYLTAMRSCMTAFCKTTSNPFCTCYKRGYDLTTNGCVCVPFDAEKFCDNAAGLSADAYDCAAASSGVSSYCVPVSQ